ncbi:MAG TPA: hypothetical protein VKX17_10420 [Planctomycetota bacterium]|nr:hypothetical protein [Planctomycetota bacterium]
MAEFLFYIGVFFFLVLCATPAALPFLIHFGERRRIRKHFSSDGMSLIKAKYDVLSSGWSRLNPQSTYEVWYIDDVKKMHMAYCSVSASGLVKLTGDRIVHGM